MTDLRERVDAAIGAQYQIENEIGRGGMSVVFRARDLRLNRLVAIKVLPPELAHDAAVRSRFTREAQTSAQLSHPNIVPIFDVGEREGIAYFVMALVTGGNLAKRIEEQQLRPISEVRRIIGEVADALAFAHLRGVIHRDIKADNILLDSESGRAMVTDFGIARAMEEGARLTQTGIAVGTPAYMSPEQAVGDRDIDGRTDVYSLGVVAYQMLTGRVPFTAGNSMALLLKHVSERPRPILDLRPETPAPLAEAVERALAKTPETRWPTASAFRDAIVSSESVSTWRNEAREPVRYLSPIPRSAAKRPTQSAPSEASRSIGPTVSQIEPPHLAGLSAEQRADLLLWHGRFNLVDRIRLARRFALYTLAMSVAGMIGFVAGVDGVPPFVLSPIVPIVMWVRLMKRGRSLRASGLKLRRVFLALRAKNVLRSPAPVSDRKLEKLATRAVLEGPNGALIRRAADDRAAINDLLGAMSRDERSLIPEVKPTVEALFERVVSVAQALHRMASDLDASLLTELNERISSLDASGASDHRRTALIQRQRDTLQQLTERRATLTRQMESAAIALGNLRLDLIKLRSSGVASGLDDVVMATEQARALSRDIALALDAAAELRDL
jgi:serine/threonine-protein kinase